MGIRLHDCKGIPQGGEASPHNSMECGKNYSTTKLLLRKMAEAGVVLQPTEGHYALSPSYLSTTINPINSVNPINPINPVNPEAQSGSGFTRVYGGFTGEEKTQPLEKQGENGDRVYGFTGFMGFTSPLPCADCQGTVRWDDHGTHRCLACYPPPTQGA